MALTPAQQIALQRTTGGFAGRTSQVNVIAKQKEQARLAYLEQQRLEQQRLQEQRQRELSQLSNSEQNLIRRKHINLHALERRDVLRDLMRAGFSQERAQAIVAANEPHMKVYGASREQMGKIAAYGELRGGLTPEETREVIVSGSIEQAQLRKLTPQTRQAIGVSDYEFAKQERLISEAEAQQKRLENYQKMVEEAKRLGYTFDIPKPVQEFVESRKVVTTLPALTETKSYLGGLIKVEKTIVPERIVETIRPTWVSYGGMTWRFEGGKTYVEPIKEFKPSVLAPVSSMAYYFEKAGKSISGYETYGKEYERTHPVASKVIRWTGSYINKAAPFVIFSPLLATSTQVARAGKPIKPKKPEVTYEKSRVVPNTPTSEGIANSKYLYKRIVKVPKTYMKYDSAFSMGKQRVQVSPTIIMEQELRAPIKVIPTEKGMNLRIQGAIREQRILPETTRFKNFRGYDVKKNMFTSYIKPVGELSPTFTRARVTSLITPIKSQIRVYSDKVWMREAGKLGGKTLTIKSTGERILKIPTPVEKYVGSQPELISQNLVTKGTRTVQVPFGKNLLGFESTTSKEPTTFVSRIVRPSYVIKTPLGDVLQKNYAQIMIQTKPYVKGYTTGRIEILTNIKPTKPVGGYFPATRKFLQLDNTQFVEPNVVQINTGLELTKFIQAPSMSVSIPSYVSQASQPYFLLAGGLRAEQRQVPEVSNIDFSVTKDITMLKTPQDTLQIQGVSQVQEQKYGHTQVQTQAQIQQLQQPKITPQVFKPTTPKIEIPIIKPFDITRREKGTVKRIRDFLATGYKTFIYVGGKKKYLSGISPRREAIKKGEKIVLGTVAARFGIEATKTRIRAPEITYKPSEAIFRGYRIMGKKRIPLKDEWIQKMGGTREPSIRGGRLSSRAETSELVSFRRKKRKGGFFSSLL